MTEEEFYSAINTLRKGNKEGLRQIYDAYIRLIYSVVYNTVGNKQDAEDVTSEFFIKLVKVSKQYKRDYSHKAWLTTIAKNMSIDFLRKNRREVLVFDNSNDNSGNTNDAIDTIQSDEYSNPVEKKVMISEDIKRAMKCLSPREKEIIDLKIIGDFKFREIADMFQQPIGTVTWIYNQGINKMRGCLGEYRER